MGGQFPKSSQYFCRDVSASLTGASSSALLGLAASRSSWHSDDLILSGGHQKPRLSHGVRREARLCSSAAPVGAPRPRRDSAAVSL